MRTVLSMFLARAALIAATSGVTGLPAGYGLSCGLARLKSSFIQPQHQQGTLFGTFRRTPLTINPVFTHEWTIIAFFFSVVVCLIIGLYPARKASKLNPMEALRYKQGA